MCVHCSQSRVRLLWVCACGLGGLCLWGEAEQEKLERAAATQNMDRAFTWPCALWVRQVAASSTGPPTWATRCCYCRCRHRSVRCCWEACRHIHTHTYTLHHFLHMDEYTPELQENVDTSTELWDKTIAVRDGGSCQGDIYQQTLTEPTVIFKSLQIHWSTHRSWKMAMSNPQNIRFK